MFQSGSTVMARPRKLGRPVVIDTPQYKSRCLSCLRTRLFWRDDDGRPARIKELAQAYNVHRWTIWQWLNHARSTPEGQTLIAAYRGQLSSNSADLPSNSADSDS